MLTPIVLFLLLSITLSALFWSAMRLFGNREDPLSERLDELQSQAMATGTGSQRRRGSGFLDGFLYAISLVPGGEGWLRDSERELAYAGVRQRRALAFYALFHIGFLGTLVGLAIFFEQNQEAAQKFV